MDQRVIEAENEMKLKEQAECTFQPNTANDQSSNYRVSPLKRNSTSKSNTLHISSSRRSKERLVNDLLTFKEKRENRLERIRKQDMQEIKHKA